MSVSGNGSNNNNLPPNGRKRKLSSRRSQSSLSSSSSSSSSGSSSKQSKLNFHTPPNPKRLKLSNSNSSPPLLHHTNSFTEEEEFESLDRMAAQHHQPGTNNRLSFGGNNFVVGKGAAAVSPGTNNHVKKPSQGKKIIIKNRKGKSCRLRGGYSKIMGSSTDFCSYIKLW